MRNKFISDYIYQVTGKHRTPKQVGSCLQQLRDTCEGKRSESRSLCPDIAPLLNVMDASPQALIASPGLVPLAECRAFHGVPSGLKHQMRSPRGMTPLWRH